MEENPSNQASSAIENGTIKGITNVIKKVTVNSENISLGEKEETINNESGATFKVAGTNLPEKTSTWTKVKNALFYEIKVELTPYQQKIEDEVNDFLHQEITWKSLKEVALSEVIITFKGKRVF